MNFLNGKLSDSTKSSNLISTLQPAPNGSITPAPTDRKHYERDTRLLNMDKLAIPPHDRGWFQEVNAHVLRIMNDNVHDASHDYEHIQRVVNEAWHLWNAEKHNAWARNIDPLVILVGAMTHDIGDEKYRFVVVDEVDTWYLATESVDVKQKRQRDVVRCFLDNLKCPPAVAGPASHVAALVSYTREHQDPERVRVEAEAYPALKFIQDADRLDALGPMGMTRCALYGGAKSPRRNNTILTVGKLIDERFSLYPGYMKTKTGKKEAEKRLAWMVQYKEDLMKQADCDDILL